MPGGPSVQNPFCYLKTKRKRDRKKGKTKNKVLVVFKIMKLHNTFNQVLVFQDTDKNISAHYSSSIVLYSAKHIWTTLQKGDCTMSSKKV